MLRVKICGITNGEDASMAAALGADALGFIFARSPRAVSPVDARDIIASLPPFVKTVGVFVNEQVESIRQIRRFCNLDLVQLHGDEPPELCLQLMPGTIKAFRLGDGAKPSAMGDYLDKTAAMLLDTYEKGNPGGTGTPFDWRLAARSRDLGPPLILAGGIGPENVREAFSQVEPYAIDVNSGIECRPGKKDPALMKKLMEAVRTINRGG